MAKCLSYAILIVGAFALAGLVGQGFQTPAPAEETFINLRGATPAVASRAPGVGRFAEDADAKAAQRERDEQWGKPEPEQPQDAFNNSVFTIFAAIAAVIFFVFVYLLFFDKDY
mmetsp:Transcript_54288/g.129382  ORF Transcript_54288/g.129382 Transcript_54288/m.129382 type:complete len:114 (-) Transcript_54288:180-521(-)|eukprot:CAMPEP_0178400662 /NCGR_PEP_ID=MMETSP0689_2-20121128/15905_1 /TAXON_ID=160604 /ORGANISM="Amphidinium massartii, Strain CS-259" /LENGTH=113 /DNA_ID=CAMNT_0020021465 /DNA_START=84 /DNA_END=425 /DNA_ORIENTATION=+